MSKVDEILKQFGEKAVAYIKEQLMKSQPKGVQGRQGNTIATGSLYNSINYKTDTNGKGHSVVYINGDSSLGYVARGRKPGKFPPIDAIVKWMMDKRIKPTNASRGRLPQRSVVNYQKITKVKPKIKIKKLGVLENEYRSAAFLIGRSIKKYGIKPIPLGIAGTGLARNQAFDNASLTKALATAAKEDALINLNAAVKEFNL